MPETIEVTNETNKRILVSACRSKSSGTLYVHMGKKHGNETVVKPNSYAKIEVRVVEY